MHLRHTTEETQQEKPWYRQMDTTVPVPATAPSPQATQTQELPPRQQLPAVFEPSTAERILARAGALQEIQGQLLSHEEIEAIAAEMGIKPEFVQLAIEQEKAHAVAESQRAIPQETEQPLEPVTTKARIQITLASVLIIAHYGLTAFRLYLSAGREYPSFAMVVSLLFVVPALVALLLGAGAKSRRWGAAAGVLTALTAMAALVFSYGLFPITFDTWALQAIALMTSSGALLGIAGAQARRWIRKRQLSNRNRKFRVS